MNASDSEPSWRALGGPVWTAASAATSAPRHRAPFRPPQPDVIGTWTLSSRATRLKSVHVAGARTEMR
jgi:hypothetical protein